MLLCSDLFHQIGDVEPLISADVVGRPHQALKEYQANPRTHHAAAQLRWGDDIRCRKRVREQIMGRTEMRIRVLTMTTTILGSVIVFAQFTHFLSSSRAQEQKPAVLKR